jgi:magnesium transporter
MERLRAQAMSVEAVRALLDRREPFWLDIDSTDPGQHALLGKVFGFHPLTIEDTLNRHTRVKVEEYDGYLFIVIRAMTLSAGALPTAHSLDVSKMCLYATSRYVVSVHAGNSAVVERAAARANGDDPGLAAHAICDIAIDDYFPILDRIDDYVDVSSDTEWRNLRSRDFREALRTQQLDFITHRSLIPQQPIFAELANRHADVLTREAQLHFRDVYDHVTRIIESLDSYRELIGMMSDSTISQISTRLDYATTIFEAIATVTIPFVVISGLFSMNVVRIPFSTNPYGFWIVLTLQAAISIVLLVLLRRRHLL